MKWNEQTKVVQHFSVVLLLKFNTQPKSIFDGIEELYNDFLGPTAVAAAAAAAAFNVSSGDINSINTVNADTDYTSAPTLSYSIAWRTGTSVLFNCWGNWYICYCINQCS